MGKKSLDMGAGTSLGTGLQVQSIKPIFNKPQFLRRYSSPSLKHLSHLGHGAGPSYLEVVPLPLITRLHQNQGQLLITGFHHLQGEVGGCLLVNATR